MFVPVEVEVDSVFVFVYVHCCFVSVFMIDVCFQVDLMWRIGGLILATTLA